MDASDYKGLESGTIDINKLKVSKPTKPPVTLNARRSTESLQVLRIVEGKNGVHDIKVARNCEGTKLL